MSQGSDVAAWAGPARPPRVARARARTMVMAMEENPRGRRAAAVSRGAGRCLRMRRLLSVRRESNRLRWPARQTLMAGRHLDVEMTLRSTVNCVNLFVILLRSYGCDVRFRLIWTGPAF